MAKMGKNHSPRSQFLQTMTGLNHSLYVVLPSLIRNSSEYTHLFSRIFKLPVEIRNLIWRELFSASRPCKAVRPASTPRMDCVTCGQSTVLSGRDTTPFCPILSINQSIALEVERSLWEGLHSVIFCDDECYNKQLEKPRLGPLRWTAEIRFPLYGNSVPGARRIAQSSLQRLETVMKNKNMNTGAEDNGWVWKVGLGREINHYRETWEVVLTKEKAQVAMLTELH